MISRRGLLAAAPVLLSLPAIAADRGAALLHIAGAQERQHGGRLGVAILDTAATGIVAHRGQERFPLCSTHKLLSVACVLARVDRGEETLARRVVYARDVLVPYSPLTAPHAGADGMTVGALCAAAVTVSDNTAANLLLGSFGGPAALTAWLRTLGDSVTRLDRYEPALNEAKPGDPRDTTTPVAMAETVRKLVLGSVLSAQSRAQLAAWLVACTTGGKRLRAGVPIGWRVGDKTGSGGRNGSNDVAVIWPPGRAPLVVSAYYVGSPAPADVRDAALAAIGRFAASG